jgi:uncharacterized protein (DUF1800 family)
MADNEMVRRDGGIMALSPEKAGFIALTRFGYGARGDGDLAAAASDPRGCLKAELAQPGITLLSGSALPRTPMAVQALFADQAAKKAERERLEKEKADMAAAASSPALVAYAMAAPAMDKPAMEKPAMEKASMESGHPQNMLQKEMTPKPPPPPSPEGMIYKAEATARLRRAVEARVGFAERLVAFWSNHFCISANKSQFGRITVGAFEREAIRPHVLGKFSDMLFAVESHPAMLHYLDNAQSIGPQSKVGLKSKRGLNENFAREIMELHTLGVGGGYSQDDVTSLARILTGWTSVGPQGKEGEPGSFYFNPDTHEPGTQLLLGRAYPQYGVGQGEAVLIDLARRPSTAKFIAAKFARHFISDQPPDALVHRLAGVFQETDGDLKALTFALIDSDEAWNAPLTKIRTPYEFLIAVHRATDHVPEDAGQILGPLNVMGMPLWTPPGPNGFADTSAAWASPEGMKLRLDLVAQYAAKMKDPPNPSDLLDALCGGAASAETRVAVAHAESRQQGLALLLMSPEMQRR